MADPAYDAARRAAGDLRTRLGTHAAALVLGSGWADVVERLGDVRASVPMTDLAGFPPPAVAGHSGLAHRVDVGGVPLLVLAGRTHLYEGHPVAAAVHGVRAAVLAGCRAVLLTNAAGVLMPGAPPGTPVLIRDHLNLTGQNPMAGPGPPDDLPGRFVDLSDLYSVRLRAAARAAAPGVPEGVYAGLLGGSYETPAEVAMLRALGADLVGMSTVLEAVAARHLGAEVFGVSLVTNMAAGLSPEALDHADVLRRGRDAVGGLVDMLRAVVAAV
ncbi:MAG TPA: purine-nucleoside phosphorylase [Miltoncostaeaceae bacterium]|nr:purine-nucleoside phosphorylase [Miltoncostaeaceae bacterium]